MIPNHLIILSNVRFQPFAWFLKYSFSEIQFRMAAFLLVVFLLQVPLPCSFWRQWKAEVSCFVLFIFSPWFYLGFFDLVDFFLFQFANNPFVISCDNRSLKCGEKWRRVLRFFILIFMDTSNNEKSEMEFYLYLSSYSQGRICTFLFSVFLL